MNKVVLMGRLVRDPEVRYTQGEEQLCIARFTLAVDRRGQRSDGQKAADFISCTAFGRTAEFFEKYVQKGMKMAITGHIQTGSYTNRDGQKVYTTDVAVEEAEFAESKATNDANRSTAPQQPAQNNPYPAPAPDTGFMNIPDGIDEELPFN